MILFWYKPVDAIFIQLIQTGSCSNQLFSFISSDKVAPPCDFDTTKKKPLYCQVTALFNVVSVSHFLTAWPVRVKRL